MTKKELVAYVAEKANLSKKDAEIAVNSVFDGITEALKTDGKIQLVGFGSFEVKERAARMGKIEGVSPVLIRNIHSFYGAQITCKFG